MQVYQQFDINSVLPARNFIKNETPVQMFSHEFLENFLLAPILE